MKRITMLIWCLLVFPILTSCKASKFADSTAQKDPIADEKLVQSSDQRTNGNEDAENPVNVSGIYLTCTAGVSTASASEYGCALVDSGKQPMKMQQSFKQYQWSAYVDKAASGVSARSETVAGDGDQVNVSLNGDTQQGRTASAPATIVAFNGVSMDNRNIDLKFRLSEAIGALAKSIIAPDATTTPLNNAPTKTINDFNITTVTVGSQSFALCPSTADFTALGGEYYIPGSRQDYQGKYYFDYIKDKKTGTLVRDFCGKTGDGKWQYENSNAGDGCTCLTTQN